MEQNPQSNRLKLTYFAARGRIEPTRLMLEMAQVPYDIETIPAETWRTEAGKPRFLSRTPLGQLPILQDGELVLCQSQAIDRYIARKLGLCGDNAVEMARVDEVAETAGDLTMDMGLLFWDPRFAEKRDEHRGTLRTKLAQLESYFSRTAPDAEHWVLPGRYTHADVRMSFALENTLPLHPGLLQEFPKLYHAMMRFFDTDGVRQYVRSSRRARTYTVAFASFGGKPEETHHFTD